MARYTQRKLAKEWSKLFPEITSKNEKLTIQIGKEKIDFDIPKKQSLVKIEQIGYR